MFVEVVLPVLQQFDPDLILVSAGFDAHERDPLAGMRLTTGAFGAMTMALRKVAETCCGGRIAAIVEGGYDLRALAESMRTVVDVLAGPPAAPEWPRSDARSTRGPCDGQCRAQSAGLALEDAGRRLERSADL